MERSGRKNFTFADDGQGMELDNGNRLGPVTLDYETYGRLSPEGDNAILILHAFSGDSHVASHPGQEGEAGAPGWWESMVGSGKAIDTERYFVICSNILGSCMGSTGPCSENPATKAPYGLDFPVVTIGDMVRAQKALIDHLHISNLLSVIGGSVGGMQALQWCVSYPGMVRSAIPLATTMRHSAQAIAFNEIARQAIMADPKWQQGGYGDNPPELGLAVARMIGHVTYLSDEALRRKFGRRLQHRSDFSFKFDSNFQVESYLRYQGAKFVRRFDANSFLYITKAADYFDLSGNKEGATIGLAGAATRFLVISFSSDWLYPTYQSKELVRALKREGLDVSFCEVKADCGHDAFLIENELLQEMIRGFLNGVMAHD